jgi:hypothetical protein
LPSPSRVAASAARIFSRRDKVLVGLLEELERVGVAFRSATEPIDTSTPTGDREKPWEVRQRRLLDSLERRGVSPYRRPHGHGLTRPHGHRNRGQHRERGLARVYRGLPARGADDGLMLRLGSYGEQSDVRGQDAEVACPQGHLFRDPVVYPEVIGCASRNGGSTEGVPYWRPHLRIEKELDYGDLIVYPVQYLPWDRTEDRVTPGWWGENYPRLAEASANAPGPVRLPASRC